MINVHFRKYRTVIQSSEWWWHIKGVLLSTANDVGLFIKFVSFFSFFIPATTANDLRLRRIFYPRFYPLHLFSYLNSWERASIVHFECSELNKGNTGTIFITSLVWRGPWLGIEPGASRTRSQHSTTMLSRRRYSFLLIHTSFHIYMCSRWSLHLLCSRTFMLNQNI